VVVQDSSMGSIRHWQVCTPQTSGVIELPGLPESGMKYSVDSVTIPVTEIIGLEKYKKLAFTRDLVTNFFLENRNYRF
jgi:hypothetical protein